MTEVRNEVLGLEVAERCPYCGGRAHGGPVRALCSVCGMGIDADHYPHIIRIESDKPPAHFCSVACTGNFEYLEAGEDG